MIEVENIIKLQTNSETEVLSFETRYLVYEHFTFYLKVVSEDFAGKASFCLDRSAINQFCETFEAMYQTLTGTAELKDYDSDAFVRFYIQSNGILNISGQVGDSNDSHLLKFEFRTDQTTMPHFINDFNNLLLNIYR